MIRRIFTKRLFCQYVPDSDLKRLSKPIRKKKAVETFKSKVDRKRKEEEETVFEMDFSQMTQDLNSGRINSVSYEIDQISKQKQAIEKNTRAEVLGIKGRRAEIINKKSSLKIENLEERASSLIEQNSPDSLSYPWIFFEPKEPFKSKPEGNLKGLMPYTHLVTSESMSHLFKSFFMYWSERDFELLEDICEPYFIKCLKKEANLLPNKYRISSPNLRKSKALFDLYEVKNIYMSNVNTNRKRADSINNFNRKKDNINGVEVEFLSKKRPGETDQCGIIMQFHFNVYTDMLIQIVDNKDNVVLEDYATKLMKQGGKPESIPLNFKVEILTSEGNFHTLKKSDYKGYDHIKDREPITNHMSKRNFRIIDMNNYMSGNPLLVGLDWLSPELDLGVRPQSEIERKISESHLSN